jgi:hypothetical protein
MASALDPALAQAQASLNMITNCINRLTYMTSKQALTTQPRLC